MSADAVQEVLCPNPSCQKKYRLKGTIPPVFTCTKCGQAMDLSAFAPPPPAPATRSARAAGKGARGPTRRGREVEEPEEERRPRFEPKPKNNTPLIVGSLVGLVLVVVLLIVVMGKKDEPAPTPEPGTAGAAGTPSAPGAGVPTPGVPAAAAPGVPSPAVPTPGGAPAAGTPSGAPAPSAPAPSEPSAPAEPPKRGGGLSNLQVWQPPEELKVTAEEKERIEALLQTALNDTGRAALDAEAGLVALDRKAIWRVVSEFKHIHDTQTFEQRMGLRSAMIVDRILRKTDGYMERKGGHRQTINPESSPDWALGIAKRWNGWLEKGYWKTKLTPWDPRVDEADEGAEKPAPRGR